MNTQIESPLGTRQVLLEVALIFAVFFVQGAAPVPEVNEPYYLGKAIHRWNPDWVQGDGFLESDDTHEVFYFTFGWLSLWMSPVVLAWFGRVLTWGLLAWAWQRLSTAVAPRRWFSVLAAALLVCLSQRCHMAGEWVIGGVEAKGFAFVLVLLGLEALVRNRWNRAWLLLGAASAFHVLVGGWSVVAAGLAWLQLGKDRPALRSMWPAILAGFLLSLPGLVPSLMLDWGTGDAVIRRAHQIYVFERLYHHLDLLQIPVSFIRRFVLLLLLWLAMCWVMPPQAPWRRLRAFVIGAVVIGLVGAGISLAGNCNLALAAGLLRFYWFRLADVAVPLGVALGATSLVVWKLRSQPVQGKCWLGIVILAGGIHVGVHLVERAGSVILRSTPPPADRLPMPKYVAWKQACNVVARSGRFPPGAKFLTPRMSQTFKWHAGRAEVVNWKEIPQDARGILKWWERIEDLYATGSTDPRHRWHESLAALGAERLRQVGARYGAEYVITLRTERPLPLEVVYCNESYIIYRL